MTIALAPGALASVAANPSCTKGPAQYTSACRIGTGEAVAVGLLPVSLDAYLVPPPAAGDLVGIDLVPQGTLGLIPNTHIGGPLVQTAGGNVQSEVYLTGQPVAPTMTLRFPPPAALTLVGTIGLADHAVTFPRIPDVPVTQLTVSLAGGPKALLNGACGSPTGTLHGAFTAQNGKTAKASKAITLGGCSGVTVVIGSGGTGSGRGQGPGGTGSGPSKPGADNARLRVSRFRVFGLARGKPTITFTLARGTDARKLRSFTVTLPRGLAFVHRRLGAGIRLRPAHKLRLRGRRVTITLKRAVNSVKVRIGAPAVSESRQLRRHPKGHLTFRIS